MDLTKHIEYFDPISVTTPIHLIGLGAIGSNLAHQLTRLGMQNLILYDFDTVDEHNIPNQMYRVSDLKKLKIDATAEQLRDINPEINITLHPEGWTPSTQLFGYVFLCVDSIDLRRRITESIQPNCHILFLTDIRIGLSEGQMYAADWTKISDRKRILSTMQFSDDEVDVPVSACGTALEVLPTIQTIVSMAVMNFIAYLKKEQHAYQINIDTVSQQAIGYKDEIKN